MILGQIFWSFVVFLFGAVLFWSGFSALGRKRLVEDTPTSKIRSLAMGRVEIHGTVVPCGADTIKAPLSGKDCVWYKYTIEELRSQGKSSKWVVIKSGTEGRKFRLKDETGEVLVEPKGAEFDVPKTFEASSKWGTDPPAGVLSFLKNNGISFEGLLGINKSMRFAEYAVKQGDALYIMGTAGDNPAVEASAKGTENIMMQKGKNETFYYISTKSEKEVRNSLGWQAVGSFLFGTVLVVVAFVMFLFGVFGSE